MPVRIGRRMFLRGATGALLGIPFLPSLLGRRAAAGTPEAPRRFIAVGSCSGQLNTNWYPTWQPTGYQLRDDRPEYAGTPKIEHTTYLHAPLPEDPQYRAAPMTDFLSPTGFSKVLTERLNPFLDKVNVLRGIDVVAGPGHGGGGAILGNYNDGGGATPVSSPVATIDQVMAYSDRFAPTQPGGARSLHIGTGWGGSISHTDFGIPGGSIVRLNDILNPFQLWDTLFAGFTPPDPSLPPPEPRPLALMNGIYEDYRQARNHHRLGAADSELLERHVAFLADIENGLRSLGGGPTCTPPAAPPSIYIGSPWTGSADELQTAVSLMIDMLAAAIRCDMTRVATITLTEALQASTGVLQRSLHNSEGVAGDWHDYAHTWGNSALRLQALTEINQWITNDVIVPLLERLDVEEADGRTFLDNSLVVWGNELALNHYNTCQPTFMAGGAGGAIRTGRYIDYTAWDTEWCYLLEEGLLIPGVPHQRFLVTCLRAMGLTPPEYERYGWTGYGDPTLYNVPAGWGTWSWDLAKIDQPLPGLLVDG